MNPILPFLWAAGVVQLGIESANLFAPRQLQYRENLARVSPIVREIFTVLCVYIVLVVSAFAVICFLFAGDLAGQSPLGRFLSGFLALFWGLRCLIQLFFYDRDLKRQHPVFNALFLTAFVYLTAVFTVAVLGLAS